MRRAELKYSRRVSSCLRIKRLKCCDGNDPPALLHPRTCPPSSAFVSSFSQGGENKSLHVSSHFEVWSVTESDRDEK